MGQIQAVRRTDRPTGGAVSGVQGGLNIRRRPRPGTNPFESADKTADLIVQKRPGTDIEMVFGAAGRIDAGDAQVIQCLDRAFGLTNGRAEGGEIVLANQDVCGGLHGRDIKGMFDLPDQPLGMGGRGAAAEDTKEIPPLKRRETGMEIIPDGGAIDNRNGQRFEMVIQCLRQSKRRPVTVHVAMGNLTQTVHACVGAASGGNIVRARFQLGKGRFNSALHRGQANLPLPADKRGTVVFDFQRKTGHGRDLACAPGSGNPRRGSLC